MHSIGQHLQKTKLTLAVVAILILSSAAVTVSCAPQSEQGKDHEDNNIVIFSNPPESQRFKGDYGPSFAAQQVIELDHYLIGYKGESPRLYIEYTNISNETVKIDIGIMWLVAHNDIVRQVGQCDIRPPISPGQSERLTYRPIVESPSEIVNYCIVVHSLLDEQLPHVAFGPQVGPEETTTSPAPAPVTTTKAELVEALKELREVMLKKIDSDIDNTAIAFTDVKDYWRSKRWADIFTAPLRILEDVLISLAKASDVKSLATEANTALNSSEAAYQVLTTIMMLQDLQEVGEKLHYGLDGPTYISSIESMLEAADATFVPPSGDDWQKNYQDVIENHLYGVTKDTPLIIPRQSTTLQRKNIEFAKGALEVRSSIARTFDNLTAEIEGRELPASFPIDKVIAQIKELERQVIKSMGYSVEVEYKTDFQGPVKTNLGAVGSLYRAFGQIAGRVAEKLEIEQRVEVFKLAETVESAALLYTIAYKIPGAEEIKITQKVTTLAELSVKPYQNTFYSDPEKEFYMLPQEMVLTLPGELSNLWVMADDTDQYLRNLLGEVDFATQSKLTIAPTSGPAGTEVQISGTGFGSDRAIIITFGSDVISTTSPALKTDSQGYFCGSLIIPAVANDIYTVKASDGTIEAEANFTITAAATLSQTTGHVGTEITVNGTGFAANAAVTVTYDDTIVATVAADSYGAFSVAFVAPPSATGNHTITITDGRNTVQRTFTIES